PFIGRSDLFKDGIHPNASGNELLAGVIQDAITAADDNQAPSAPSGVTANAPSTTSVTLTWSASNGTPTGYEIYRGEECVKVVAAANRSFTETGLTPGIYNYQVRAFDRALNLSAKSAVVSINTNGSTPDIDPPSIPGGLSGTVSGTSVTLTWNASTDNIGVTGYEMRRGNTSIGTTSGTSKVDSGLSYGSTYAYSVRAFDAAGNYSDYCTSISVIIPDSPLPDTWESRDIGAVGIAGSQSLSLGEFTLSASGSDIYTNADNLGFTYKAISGDGTITARVKSIQNTHEWAKCGVMIRETLEAGSKHASMVVTPRNRVVFARRSSTNANTPGAEYKSFSSFPMWVKLQRSGDTITGSYSTDGSTWTVLKEMTITMNETVYVGLALTSHNNSKTNTAIVDSVSVTTQKQDNPDPDIEPPAVPGGLTASVSGSSVNLKWNASTDNKGVAGYEIRRSGTSIANAAGTSLVDSGLSAGATYNYSVRAFDAAKNYSEYCSPISVTIPNSVVPDVWSNSDVGSVGQPGSLAFSAGEFTLKASGTDIFSTADSFGYTYSTLNGDGSITARVKSMEYTNEWAKCGVMIRETLDAGSIHASVVVAPLKKVSFQRRTSTNAGAKWGINADIPSFPAWVRIKRQGNTITGYYSSNGDVWIELYSCTMTMKQQVYIGLALSSHNNARINTTVVDNVTVSREN
ncbi:MAG: DUF1349 domain-containing protein, partial [Opitutales bacterium]|nr:DUF1349 domain-containing protein [Opitutales bacterium]